MDNLSASQDSQVKWQNSEKWVIRGLAGIAGLLGFYYWGKILPFILKTLTNTIYFGLLMGVVAILAIIIMNPRFRLAVSYLIQMFIRKFLSIVIAIDPIEIMKINVEKAEEKEKELDDNINKLSGTKEKLEDKMTSNNEKIKELFKEASYAQAHADQEGMNEESQLKSYEATGLQENNEALLPLHKTVSEYLEFCEKLYKALDFMIKKTKKTIELQEERYNDVKEAYKTMNVAMSILKGNPDKNFAFQQSLEIIQRDTASKLGEMKRAMNYSQEFINSIDIQKGVCSEKGLEMLKKYNEGGLKLINDFDADTNPKMLDNKGATPMKQLLSSTTMASKTKVSKQQSDDKPTQGAHSSLLDD